MKIDWDEFDRTRGEFNLDGNDERSDQEHPEQAYRRGVQQGAYFVLQALEADPSSIDRKLLRDIKRYVESTLARWRYGPRRLGRQMRRDDPPRVKRARLSFPMTNSREPVVRRQPDACASQQETRGSKAADAAT
jgi:hypothetical protein